jgi:hypothetical protein
VGTNNMTQVGTNHLILAACVSCVSYLPHVSLVSVHLILASCVCACLHAYCIHVCSSLHTCMLITAYMYAHHCIHVCSSVCMDACLYACTCVMHAHVHTCMHAYTSSHANMQSMEARKEEEASIQIPT